MTGAGSGGAGTDAGAGGGFGLARWMAVRAALEPLWVVAQGEWGDVHEGPPSQGMARYTVEFVALLAPGWPVVTGLVHDGGGGWSVPHAWNEHGVTGAVVDLTGDQHGRAPAQLGADLPPGYLPSPCPPGERGGNLYRDRAIVWLIDLERLADRSRHGDPAASRRADVGVWCPCCGCWEEVADTIVSADRSRLWCRSWCDAADPSGRIWRQVPGACYGDGHPGPATDPPSPPSRLSRPDGWGWAS